MQADRFNRQLHLDEALIIEQLQAEDPERAHGWNAAACALVGCSEGVSPTDPNYANVVKLQNEGGKYPDLQASLKATGKFERSFAERMVDAGGYYGEELHYVKAGGNLGGGVMMLSQGL